MNVAMPGDTLSIALDILEAHPTWFLFPIKRLEKTPPLFKDELETNNSNDPKKIREWHNRYLGCNWGIALKKSKLIVVDVDTKPGKGGQATFDELELIYGTFPDTLTITTPSGGKHYYFNEANGVQHRMAVNGFGKDVDSTNYVVAPGCWLSSGGTYAITNDTDVAPSPAWFAKYINNDDVPAAVVQTPEVVLDKPENIAWAINYLQNDAPPSIMGANGEFALLLVGGTLKDRGISLDTAINLVDQYYNVFGKCDPLWSVGEGPLADRLDAKLKNAYSYLKKSAPGSATAEADFFREEAKLDAEQNDYITALAARDQAVYDAKLVDKRSAAERTAKEIAPETDEAADDPPPLPGDVLRDLLPGGPRASLLRFPLETLDDSQPITGFNDICRRWVWITGIERFVNRSDPTVQWKQSQFDSEYNRWLKEGPSASKYLFKEERSRIQRFRYLAFRPGKGEFMGAEYNVWRPGPIQPAFGDTTLWNEHINNLFQDENDRDAVLNWMAWIVQNPTKKPNHALLIVGRKTGTGKSFVARVLEQIVGERNTQRPKNSSMGGDFNSWIKDCRLCIIEEVMQVNRRENVNALRDLITEPTVEVNMKGIPAFKIPNYVCMMGVSNHPDALPLDENDRRWLIVETHAQPRDKEYYTKLFDALPGEFGEPPINPDLVPAIYDELLARDLKGYSGYDRPVETDAKRNMIEQSRSDAESWLFDNASNAPLARDIVTAQDVKDAMPADVQRTSRLMTVTIPNFLRDKLNGTRIRNARRLSNGQRVCLWVLRNKATMIPDNQLVGVYEKQRKSDNKKIDENAADDFNEVE